MKTCRNMNQMDYSFTSFYRPWALAAALVNLVGIALAVVYGLHMFWILGVMFMFGIYLGRIKSFVPRLPWGIGYANWVSFIRLLIVMTLFVFHDQLSNYMLFGGYLLAIALDGVDGFLARKYGHSTEAGGQFDMEVDAFLVLALSWIHFSYNDVHWFILIPGAFRYLFEVLLVWIPERQAEILPKRVRSTVAVLFFLSLLIPFVTSKTLYLSILYLSGAFIVCSFLLSIYSQLKPSSHGNLHTHT